MKDLWRAAAVLQALLAVDDIHRAYSAPPGATRWAWLAAAGIMAFMALANYQNSCAAENKA